MVNKKSHNDLIEDKSGKKQVALAMMVKNEHLRITVSLDSVKNFVDSFIILDTGSEDNTISIVKNYCNKHNKKLHLIEQSFPLPLDYATARNVLLDFADDKADFLLLLDCNDELRNGENIRPFVETYKGPAQAFHVCQEWWNGQSLDKYFNIRFVKTKYNWRYQDEIHEFIISPEAEKKDAYYLVTAFNGIILFQDRTKDDDKSSKRFTSDRNVLHKKYQNIIKKIDNDPDIKMNPRTVFYYGQTCMCLRDSERSYKLNRERTKLEGFLEEKYHSFYRCGEESVKLKHDWEESMTWYIKAFEFSSKIFISPRAEPLIRIAEYYYENKNWEMCYLFLKRCCELVYPSNAVLFVDKHSYDYTRWNLMSKLGLNFNGDQRLFGKYACARAIIEKENDEDYKNMSKYISNKKEQNIYIQSEKKKIEDEQKNRNFVPENFNNQEIFENCVSVEQIPQKDRKEILREKLQSMKNNRK